MQSIRDIEASLGFGSPTELYLFEHGEDVYAYTSSSKRVLHTDGVIYNPLPIKRDKIQRSQQDNRNRLQIDVPGDSPIPMIFRNKQPKKHVTLKVFRFHRYTKESWLWFNKEAELPGEFITIFSGEVVQTTWNNTVATLDCASVSALQRRQCLRFGYQAQCNHHVFDELCGLKIQDWQEEVTVTSIQNNGFTINVTGLLNSNDYYKGSIISKNDDDFRDVLSVNAGVITLFSPLSDLVVGDKLKITKGCDRSSAACKSFNNFDNFFGFVTIPTDNPFI